MTGILYESQEDVLLEVDGKPQILELGTGSGKTLISLHEYMDNYMDYPLLVVCPNGKFREGGWDREIEFMETHYGIKFNYDIIPYSHLWTKRKKRGKPTYEYNKELDKYKDYYIIFDEIHFVKNPTSERGKTAIKMIKDSNGFMGLSGTPLSNGWEDSINYFIMFGVTPNKTQFIKKYAKGVDKFYKPYGWNHNELSTLWKRISVFRDKHDMTDLPELQFTEVFFKSSTKYKKIKKDRVCDGVAYDSLPKLYSGLRQFANLKSKGEYLNEILESTNDNVVVFYNFNVELEEIKKSIPKGKKVYYANGEGYSIPTKDKWGKVKNSVSVVQYQSGGTGIEMQYAHDVVFFSPTFSYQDYEQSLGRVYRTGQNSNVMCYQFKTKGTVEMNVWKALKDKRDFNPTSKNLE